MSKNKSKYYVVWVGQNPGIYESWQKCQEQIKGFPNARYKSFKSLEEAELAFSGSALEHMSSTKKSSTITKGLEFFKDEIEENSICVDAACSNNPGLMEYRGVNTWTKDEIFRIGPLEDGTNNIGEFLALVHALALLKQENDNEKVVYTDSKTAMSWVRNKKVKSTLQKTGKNNTIFILLERAIKWLQKNQYKNQILKWNTEKWGEIPADFGRK